MKNKKLLLAAVLLSSFSILLSPSVILAAAKPIVLGLPTSFFQPLCKSGKLAVEMAIDEINAQGGIFVKDENVKRPLKLVTADTRCGEPGTPVQAALMAVDKLITEEKPDAIVVAPFRSEAMVATLDLIAKYKMITLQTISQSPKLIEIFQGDPEKYKYWFRATTNSIYVGTVAAKTMDAMRVQFKHDKFFVIAQDTLWARAAADAAKAKMEGFGWKTVGYEPVAVGTNDFSPVLSKARSSGAQMLYVVGDMPTLPVCFKQWKTMKIPTMLFLDFAVITSPKAWQTYGEDLDYVIVLPFPGGTAAPVKALPKSIEFHDKWKAKKYPLMDDPRVVSSAYDAVFILKDGIERAGFVPSKDPDKFAGIIEATDMMGVSGRIKFDKKTHNQIFNGNPKESSIIVAYQWRAGKMIPVFPDLVAEAKVELAPWMK
ncbi:MAG: ABC transporter substrate-binding protein [Syntrophaceae bacterium]|nr:ABC transporter substrate-binding protein [Syntrophaceae bacterium]